MHFFIQEFTMPAVQSAMMPLGTPAPNFFLQDTVSGRVISLADVRSPKGTVVMFLCNHCPFVKHIQQPLISLVQRYQNMGISFVGINANDITTHPDDSPSLMRSVAHTMGFTFPYLFDESQHVAQAYNATCTPDFFVFDERLTCFYRGQFDDSRPGNKIPTTGNYLSAALDALLERRSFPFEQKPSIGCSIKWKRRAVA
jgi:thiol-disulfide isomerase/thioredoxin